MEQPPAAVKHPKGKKVSWAVENELYGDASITLSASVAINKKESAQLSVYSTDLLEKREVKVQEYSRPGTYRIELVRFDVTFKQSEDHDRGIAQQILQAELNKAIEYFIPGNCPTLKLQAFEGLLWYYRAIFYVPAKLQKEIEERFINSPLVQSLADQIILIKRVPFTPILRLAKFKKDLKRFQTASPLLLRYSLDASRITTEAIVHRGRSTVIRGEEPKREENSYLDRLPDNVPLGELLPFLSRSSEELEKDDIGSVVANISAGLKVLKKSQNIAVTELVPLARLVAHRCGIELAEVMFHLHRSGIPAAQEWCNAAMSLETELKIRKLLVSDRSHLAQCLQSGSPALITFILGSTKNQASPELEELKKKMHTVLTGVQQGELHSPFASIFPLDNVEKALIVYKAFGMNYLIAEGRRKTSRLFSDDTALGLLKRVFHSAEDFAGEKDLDLIALTAYLAQHQPEPLKIFIKEDIRNLFGKNLLMKLIECREPGTLIRGLEMLIELSNLDARDSNNETALIKAVQKGDTKAVELLFENGAHPLYCDNEGKNASDYAIGTNTEPLFAYYMQLFREYGWYQ